MTLDLPSLGSVLVALTLTSAALAGYVWRRQSGHPGLGLVAAGFVVIPMGALNYAVLRFVDLAWPALVLNNIALVAGAGLLLNGFLVMSGREPQWRALAVAPVLAILASIPLLGQPGGVALRAGINAVALAFLYLRAGASMRQADISQVPAARLLAAPIIADGCWHVIRAGLLFAEGVGHPLMPSDLLLGMHAIVQICALIVSLVAMSQLINDRLTVELRRAEALLARDLQTERDLASLRSGFVSMASHEFRTPLAIIDAAAQRLAVRERPLAPHQTQEAVRSIRSAVQRIVLLIDTMLDPAVTRSEGLRLSAVPCDLAALVRTACERHGGVVRSRVIEHEVGGLSQVVCDPDLIGHALGHLLSNADKYSPAGTVIRVTGRVDGDRALISVIDHGIGIAAEDRARIFEAFYRAPNARAYQGTGMGLSIVREIMALHRGDILVDGELGCGTTVTLSLPLTPAPAAQA